MATSRDTHPHWRVVLPATWPGPPGEMTVSAHLEIQECPRRWALSAAQYPDIWSGNGYPPRLQVAALEGSVIHLALEIITQQLTRAGVPALDSPLAAQVMRELGGYTRVVEICVGRILKRYSNNPRAILLLEHAQRSLTGQVPALRARVQSMLSHLHLSATQPAPVASTTPRALPSRGPLRKGIYSEVELRATSIGWKGKADLIVLDDGACEITDFKTGAIDEAHAFQVRVYATLWRFDDELNPSGRLVERLVLVYESQEIDIPAPSAAEIDELGRELVIQRQASETELAAIPPAARPAAETCQYCGVRQLCDAYWSGTTQVVSTDGRFGDVELKITGRHGPTSWDAVVIRARAVPAKTRALLRLQQPEEFEAGLSVRVLDGVLARDPEDAAAPVIVTLSAFSETYRM